MATVRVELPPKLIPVFLGDADYRGAFGGRGSAKSRSFALMTAVRGYQWSKAGESGLIVCGREFMNSLDDSSLAEIKEAIAANDWLAEHYEVGDKYVRTKDGRIEYVFTGLRHNLNSIKSKSRIKLLWVDEAEPVTERAWVMAIPSVREEDGEIWVTWNPERENSPTHKRFREAPPARSKFVELNWRDNPWMPASLNRKRLDDKENRPELYDHIWEGDFARVIEGAYFTKQLHRAREENRICHVARDPLMSIQTFWDIGGTGAKADFRSIWVAQFVGKEIRLLDYRETRGQELADDVVWLRERGYDGCHCTLPFDGAAFDRSQRVSYESQLKMAGFRVDVVPNQGHGAAMMRVEAIRRLFPSMWFNEATTQVGLRWLGRYHEKIHELGHGLGPEHDDSSHCCDAMGCLAVAYEEPRVKAEPQRYVTLGSEQAGTSWMGN